MNTPHQKIGAWRGLTYVILLSVGIWPLTGFFPPPLPILPAATMIAAYQNNHFLIMHGMLLLVCSGLCVRFAIIIIAYMRENKGWTLAYTHVMATHVMAGPIFGVLTFVPAKIYTGAACLSTENNCRISV